MSCSGNIKTCEDKECYTCGMRDCLFGEALHYHHDGCPACEGCFTEKQYYLIDIAYKKREEDYNKIADEIEKSSCMEDLLSLYKRLRRIV